MPEDAPNRPGSSLPRRLLKGLAPHLVPRPDQPLPLWMIFSLLFAALYLTHWNLLTLPYYWDEAGYYIPAAWDFFRTGSLIPITTLTNAHPPLPSIYHALWWRFSGFTPDVTREAILIVAAFGLLGVWRLALRLTGSAQVAFWTVLLTGLYPIWFAQSTLAHADIFAAAATIWALASLLPAQDPAHPRRLWPAAIWFSLAALAKETSIATPLLLAAFDLASAFRAAPALRRAALRRAAQSSAWYCLCLLPLAAWYAYHRAKTGFLFGNPEFLRYNATSTMDPLRILAAFGHRLLHLTAHMNMFVPVLCTVAALMLDPIKLDPGMTEPAQPRNSLSPAVLARIGWLLLGNALAFSVLGGALLTRYLLPMYPLVLLVAVSTFRARVRYWQLLGAFAAAAFVVALFVNPPYGFAPEDNLAYAHVIRLHQRAIHELENRYPGSTVLTAWPVSDELTRPELGYVKTPFAVDRLEDFSAAQIGRAAQDPSGYSTALVFSTKEDPPSLPFHISTPAMEEQYFGLHHDLSPEAIAHQLGGEIVWQQAGGLEWAAVLRFHRSFDVRQNKPTAEIAWDAPITQGR